MKNEFMVNQAMKRQDERTHLGQNVGSCSEHSILVFSRDTPKDPVSKTSPS